MGNIVLLDDLTINKIAAGEVIERPASVVKEMVENSIDAGATYINVEIKNGGISYIRISDNGKGIQKDDMEIAFERHATSKIRQASDLDTVKSMGFRGEALASIAAISNVEMISKHTDDSIGNKIVVQAGDVLKFDEIGCPQGTTITVTNLFFNTPVRYKFLKKDFTEAGYIEEVITRLALVNPNIAFKLINSGKTIIQTNGNGKLQDVIYSIYGKDIASNILDIEYNYEDITITGVVGKPEIARSNRSNQLFFVNKRFIKDKILTGATEKAFKGMIPIGKFGFVILNIEMNPSKVDVNVHPSKLEVRFEEESTIFKAVYHAIQETLLKGELILSSEREVEDSIEVVEQIKKNNVFSNLFNRKEVEFANNSLNIIEEMYNEKNKNSNIQICDNTNIEMTQKISTEEIKDRILAEEKNIEQMLNNIEEKESIKYNQTENLEKKENKIDNYVEESFDIMYEKTFGKVPAKIEKEINEENKEMHAFDIINKNNISLFEQNKNSNFFAKPIYKFVGIVFSTYIIIEINEEMYIIDQHAAHERIMYEKIKKNYYSNTQKDSQFLLMPDVINLTHKEMAIAKDNMEIFQKAGFELEEFGENTIKLTGVPVICFDLNTKDLFLETLDEINTVARTAKQEIEERFISTIACKAAVKAKMALSKEEVEKLMDELLMLSNPFTCPHGRPTAIKMEQKDIEKKFARRK